MILLLYKLSTRRFIIRRSSFSQWSCKTEGTTDRGKDRSAFECAIEKRMLSPPHKIELSMPVRAYVGVSRCCAVAPLLFCVSAYARTHAAPGRQRACTHLATPSRKCAYAFMAEIRRRTRRKSVVS